MGKSLSFEKVGECLYRNPASGTYYALVKVRGKQFTSSLKAVNPASFKFGGGSRNKRLRVVGAMFNMAVDDRIAAMSPVDGVKEEKNGKPIQRAPSLAECRAIVDGMVLVFLFIPAEWQGKTPIPSLFLDSFPRTP